jgi:hypothetical protein
VASGAAIQLRKVGRQMQFDLERSSLTLPFVAFPIICAKNPAHVPPHQVTHYTTFFPKRIDIVTDYDMMGTEPDQASARRCFH